MVIQPTPATASGTAAAPRSIRAFIAWAVPGFLVAFSVASLPSIGLLVAPLALVVVLVVLFVTRGRGAPGILLGAGLVGLLLAWLHRDGPGETCVGTISCAEYLDPAPFLLAGIVAIAAGLAVEFGLQRRNAA